MKETSSQTQTDDGVSTSAETAWRRTEKKRLQLAGLLALLWSVILAVFAYEGLFSEWEEMITRWEDLPPSDSKSRHFALIAIEHIPADRPWPWPRLEYALCLRGLVAQLPQSVVFEVLLSEKGAKMSSFDQTFASLVHRVDHVCFAGDALLEEKQGEPLPAGAVRLSGSPRLGTLTEYRSVIWPGGPFASEGSVGLANLDVGSGEVRSLPLVFRVKDALVPSLSLQAAAVYLGADLAKTSVRLGHAIVLRDRQGKRIRTIPVDAQGRITLRYRRSPETIPRVDFDSYLVYADQAIRGQLSDDELPPLRGRQVWIGVTDGAIVPKLATPLGKMTPVELQMQISRQIVEGEFVRPLPWFVAAAMAFALCLWGARLFVRLPAVGALPAIGALFGGTVLVSVVTFFFVGLTLPLCTLFLATLGAVICGIAVRLWNFSPLQPPTPTERPTVVVEVATTASPSPPASPARAVPLGTNPARSPSVPPDEEVPLSPSLARLQGALRRLDERRRRESSSNGTNRSGSG